MGKIKEYIMVKGNSAHTKLESVGCYNYTGNLKYTDAIYEMLCDVFKMDKLATETSYVISFDHSKKPKGICKIGLGNAGSTPIPIQSVFTFLLLTGANSFIIVHNHISNIPEASVSDKTITLQTTNIASMFGIEFIGHMIINPNGYIVDGGVLDGLCVKRDKDGELIEYDNKDVADSLDEEIDDDNEDDDGLSLEEVYKNYLKKINRR